MPQDTQVSARFKTFLAKAGYIDADGPFALSFLKSRTPSARVENTGETSLFVKELPHAQEAGDDWIEQVLDFAVGTIKPKTLHNRNSWYVADFVENARDLKNCTDDAFSGALAKALGEALAGLHSPLANDRLRPYEGWRDPQSQVQPLGALSLQQYAQMPGLDRDFFVGTSQRCGDGIRALAESLTCVCAVHGDLHAGNILVTGSQGAHFKVIDWERAGPGDPAWDLGHLLSGLFGRWINRMTIQSHDMAQILTTSFGDWSLLGQWYGELARCYRQVASASIQSVITPEKIARVAGHALLQRQKNILHVIGQFSQKDIVTLAFAEKLVMAPGRTLSVFLPSLKDWPSDDD